MARRVDPNKGTILIRHSNPDREAALGSIAKTLARMEGWTALHLEQDEQDEWGVWQVAMRVNVQKQEADVEG